jgi:hypothetical protein
MTRRTQRRPPAATATPGAALALARGAAITTPPARLLRAVLRALRRLLPVTRATAA